MNPQDVPIFFPPLPEGGEERRFTWNSGKWWEWFQSFRRKPSIDSFHAHLCEYDSFISFHGARPLDVSEYYKFGLKLAEIENLNQRAREIFLSNECPWITPEYLERSIAGASKIHDKTVFVILDEREISGHYLIYGSEHVCGIGASLTRETGFDCQQILKKFGTPTVLRIALPRVLIPNEQMYELARYVLDCYWDERKRKRPPRIDWSWILKQEIPGINILDHVHPETIPDPLMQYFPYRYKASDI